MDGLGDRFGNSFVDFINIALDLLDVVGNIGNIALDLLDVVRKIGNIALDLLDVVGKIGNVVGQASELGHKLRESRSGSVSG